jgi:hypothetical protein
VISTVASGTGVVLPALDLIIVTNQGANTLLIYPPSGGVINEQSVNTSIPVPPNTSAMFMEMAALTYVSVP